MTRGELEHRKSPRANRFPPQVPGSRAVTRTSEASVKTTTDHDDDGERFGRCHHMTGTARRFQRAVATGGAGFLGSHLCERLLAEGTEIVCLDNFLTGEPD